MLRSVHLHYSILLQTPEEIQEILDAEYAVYGTAAANITGNEAISIQSIFATVPVHYYVCLSNAASDAQLASQTTVLNQDYATSDIAFTTAEIIRCSGQDETNYRNNCGPGTNFVSRCVPYLNILAANLNRAGILTYVSPSFGSNFLGIAYRVGLNADPAWAWVRDGTLPGGAEVNFDAGKTLTHEHGHVLGLSHTFSPFVSDPPRSGCDSPGDSVADTPFEQRPSRGCRPGGDTCLQQPGLDPINNFMDYTHDCCMYVFSPLQSLRMRSNIQVNRPGWLNP